LTNLLKNEAFKWSDSTTATSQLLKQALAPTPALALPNFTQPFVLEIDASGAGIGVILSQNDHPIAYFSNKFSI